jgi:hypothetical protein
MESMPIAVPLATNSPSIATTVGSSTNNGGGGGEDRLLLVAQDEESQQVIHAQEDIPHAIPLRTPSTLKARGCVKAPPIAGVILLVMFIAWGLYVLIDCTQNGCSLEPEAIIIITVIMYISQLVEALIFGCKYLRSCIPADRGFIEALQHVGGEKSGSTTNTLPRLRMDIACYHYETRIDYYTDKVR